MVEAEGRGAGTEQHPEMWRRSSQSEVDSEVETERVHSNFAGKKAFNLLVSGIENFKE